MSMDALPPSRSEVRLALRSHIMGWYVETVERDELTDDDCVLASVVWMTLDQEARLEELESRP